jgi:hypothetical protein
MPQIRYTTDNVPRAGRGAFAPVPIPTPLSTTGGEQTRLLQQWAPTPDPALQNMEAAPCGASDMQGSYAQIGGSKTYVPGLPMAFRPVVNDTHAMSYRTTPQDPGGAQSMGPNGYNTHIKIWSDNPLPVPAGDYGRVAKPTWRTQPAGTIIATAWPRPFVQWPTWGQSRSA